MDQQDTTSHLLLMSEGDRADGASSVGTDTVTGPHKRIERPDGR
ncbi:hypothetical protein [Natrinema sp. SYSU A 869]|nr:hypothetical protein [Natrinema sp. SYSU A 869]